MTDVLVKSIHGPNQVVATTGLVVRLRGPGDNPKMTVSRIFPKTAVNCAELRCIWFDAHARLRRAMFEPHLLEAF
jgi:uncharacterized protein YodC (DUF2158 family)